VNYGLYLSATGVLSSSHRQDVIANNLANVETVGFKKNLTLFHERLSEAQSRGLPAGGDAGMLARIGGGHLVSPSVVDTSQGDFETTGNNLDVAIAGSGYLQVARGDGQKRLTRDGELVMDRAGRLTLGTENGPAVLDDKGKPIKLDPTRPPLIRNDGSVEQDGQVIATLGVFKVADPSKLRNEAGNLMNYSGEDAPKAISGATVRGGMLERANVDPAIELTALIETQRALEANANMIRYQDSTLDKLVNTVGRIG
jgi:flagellar basal body rod protein FlgG